ncbi:sensor histidine kinase [Thaumasiovibrio subtropicus]|uniref:sensor histidine kinase n=1 Tax=Thaumasiovibrio subtropicus TaxID=1891207 RepID=UPI001FE5A902|nr:histidine kinase [Thaumasiovibrio subtropicus]
MYSADIEFKWRQSWIVTTLFCIATAITTMSVWPSSIWIHLAISFGYGYSAVATARIVVWLKPHSSFRLVNALSVVFSMIIGSANAFWWLQFATLASAAELMRPVLFLGILFTATCYYYFYSHEKQLVSDRAIERAKREQTEHEKALLLSQLQQLQSQIEPHFLFNTLANICVLIDNDATKAKVMLEELTALLRVTLKKSRSLLVTVEEELELISCYLFIQKVRVADRLTYDIDSNVNIDDLQIPPMLLQPLIENAVVHGIEPKASGGHIDVVLFVERDHLHVVVADTGVGLNYPKSRQGQGNGIGLSNIRDRLQRLFDGRATLKVKENEAKGVTVEIIMPIENGAVAIESEFRNQK